MYCPRCSRPNRADAEKCDQCGQDLHDFRARVFIGNQFIFVQADDKHPVALRVDDAVQTYHAPAILSRHQHAVSFGDQAAAGKKKHESLAPLPDQNKLPRQDRSTSAGFAPAISVRGRSRRPASTGSKVRNMAW